MNYNHLNKVYDYWRKDILPNLTHRFTSLTFDDYLKKYSFLPSGKWLKEFELVKLSRIGFAIDIKKFVKKYNHFCVTYNSPMKPDDGLQRIIYQLSPTFHAELSLWIWIEHENLQSYGSLFTCYHDEEEFLKFSDEIYKMRREGNTEDNPASGFAAGMIEKVNFIDP